MSLNFMIGSQVNVYGNADNIRTAIALLVFHAGELKLNLGQKSME